MLNTAKICNVVFQKVKENSARAIVFAEDEKGYKSVLDIFEYDRHPTKGDFSELVKIVTRDFDITEDTIIEFKDEVQVESDYGPMNETRTRNIGDFDTRYARVLKSKLNRALVRFMA